jgi:hypothetical protein
MQDSPRPAGTVMTVEEEVVDAGEVREKDLWLRNCYKEGDFHDQGAPGAFVDQALAGFLIGRPSTSCMKLLHDVEFRFMIWRLIQATFRWRSCR